MQLSPKEHRPMNFGDKANIGASPNDPSMFEDHLIVCYLGRNGFPKTLLYFIDPWRAANPTVPLVILCTQAASRSDRLVLEQFNPCFVQGNPFSRHDLARCGVAKCGTCVITGNNRTEVRMQKFLTVSR